MLATRRTTTYRASAALLGALLWLAPAAMAQGACDEPARRQLDFWIGSWNLVNHEGEAIATSRVTADQGGCLLIEELIAGAVTGRGITFLDPSTGDWHQHWVDNRGHLARYRGTLRGDLAELEGEQVAADGTVEQAKMTLELSSDGRVLHRVELSEDGGRTWEVAFDGAYVSADRPPDSFATAQASPPPPIRERQRQRRAPAPPPAEPALPPAADPPPAKEGVLPVSRTTEFDELGSRASVLMASPMTLRLPLGALDKLPSGYAWTSRDTAHYLCEGASMIRVRVTPKSRGDKVRLQVVIDLYSDRFRQKVRIEAALVPAGGGEAYVKDGTGKLSIGRSNSNQALRGFTDRSLDLELDRETFERLFGAAERPSLEVTLTLL